ncbi:glutathione synthetase ATP-binding domain-like protein [Lophiostoma macrostomum CBS 122681]|uniref:Glutathione synthetase ATP-binding domain-like protein n=1 Tax=Lophiostoma macrostomum CBS 122681 TaxID=1314788 RepID=A0A6A6SSC9_9PLEO|nr:glutathione synthetase ATP-binding domain-like protein [Lophiostoma macrostomum CBS 122681]
MNALLPLRCTSRVAPSIPLAVLYQKLDPPLINGVRKPKKPGGYQDSGSDIAWVLKHQCDIQVATPSANPDPQSGEGFCFPDDESGIEAALDNGATHLWANTILFAQHPLQTSPLFPLKASELRIIGQPPCFVDLYDDKAFVNELLRAHGGFTLPKFTTVTGLRSLQTSIETAQLEFPLIAKPVRGRGSHGVKLCHAAEELNAHARYLLKESGMIIVEQYLQGTEATVTVMPPSPSRPDYWAMPIVARFNHADGVAPYNGVVAVTKNSRVVERSEHDSDPAYEKLAQECSAAAKLLQCKAPIRIDARRLDNEPGREFALFDVNMKPLTDRWNMTGPGRPGREDQASLTGLAASGLGWDYPSLLKSILQSASTLQDLRTATLPVNRHYDSRDMSFERVLFVV